MAWRLQSEVEPRVRAAFISRPLIQASRGDAGSVARGISFCPLPLRVKGVKGGKCTRIGTGRDQGSHDLGVAHRGRELQGSPAVPIPVFLPFLLPLRYCFSHRVKAEPGQNNGQGYHGQ